MADALRIPNRERCYEILRENQVPPHIVKHCEVVTKVALYLARELNRVDEDLDLALIEAAALLHDVTKHLSLKSGEDHALSGQKLLEQLGYPEVARIVGQHVFLKPGPPGAPIREEEVVFYADKRVKHTEIVSLKERFRDLKVRYGKTVHSLIKIEHMESLCKLLERRLFKKLPFNPERLEELNDA
ncbi:HD domain-containing protein [Thermodesulfatator indicus]